MSEWDQIFDLRSDRRRVLFGIELATLGGTVLIVIYLIVSCCRKIRSCYKKKYSRYELVAVNSDRLSPMEWEMQEFRSNRSHIKLNERKIINLSILAFFQILARFRLGYLALNFSTLCTLRVTDEELFHLPLQVRKTVRKLP